MRCVTPETPLSGCRLLYTRSHAHWRRFAPYARRLGAIPWHLPLMDAQRTPLGARNLQHCAEAEALVFTSANAVIHLLAQYRPQHKQMLVCIGAKTAAALGDAGYREILVAPPPYDSEALLRIWHPQALTIALIGAPDGRSLLGEALCGANRIVTIGSYRRYNPSSEWPYHQHVFDVIFLSSVQTLRHLCEITPQNDLKLLKCRVLVAAMSPRIAAVAAKTGFVHCISSRLADETELIKALSAWWLSNRGILS